MREAPCSKVFAGGFSRVFGIVSPSKVWVTCPYCATPCTWYESLVERLSRIMEQDHGQTS